MRKPWFAHRDNINPKGEITSLFLVSDWYCNRPRKPITFLFRIFLITYKHNHSILCPMQSFAAQFTAIKLTFFFPVTRTHSYAHYILPRKKFPGAPP
jgi:hypothetical protein